MSSTGKPARDAANHRVTIDRLRSDIDRGRTGEKVNYPDPALAPLGTDDEAAGNPPSPAELDLEKRSRPARPPVHNPESRGFALYVTLVIIVGLVLVGLSAGLTRSLF
jgi:hypothetical protein